jgi:hypothetical protein
MRLAYDAAARQWSLEGLGESEELNDATVNTLRSALDTLRIVDVHRKPEGLSRELRKAEGVALDTAALLSLQSRGFMIDSAGYLRSNQGEVVVTMADGVEYVLRFGEVAHTDEDASGDDAGEDDPSGASRYLFVTAQFNQDSVPQPEYLPMPAEEPESGDAALGEAGGDAGGAEAGAGQADTELANEQEPPQESLEARRARVEESNRAMREQYEGRLEAARTRVSELNRRFADWYYVISDSVFRQIHVSRSDVVRDRPADDAPGADGTTDEE